MSSQQDTSLWWSLELFASHSSKCVSESWLASTSKRRSKVRSTSIWPFRPESKVQIRWLIGRLIDWLATSLAVHDVICLRYMMFARCTCARSALLSIDDAGSAHCFGSKGFSPQPILIDADFECMRTDLTAVSWTHGSFPIGLISNLVRFYLGSILIAFLPNDLPN